MPRYLAEQHRRCWGCHLKDKRWNVSAGKHKWTGVHDLITLTKTWRFNEESVWIIPSYNYSSQHPLSGRAIYFFLNCILPSGYMIYLRAPGRHCIALVHSALKKDLSQWFWCKKIWFVSILYWLVEWASSPVVSSDKWSYLLCYYVQHNHARNSQRNIEPTLHWLFICSRK